MCYYIAGLVNCMNDVLYRPYYIFSHACLSTSRLSEFIIKESYYYLLLIRQFDRPMSYGEVALSPEDTTPKSLADAHCSSAEQ